MGHLMYHIREILFLYLYDSTGFKSVHLYWMPYMLTVGLRKKRMEHAQAILLFLHAAERDGWYHLVTRDES
jgi:hypothetical protein